MTSASRRTRGKKSSPPASTPGEGRRIRPLVEGPRIKPPGEGPRIKRRRPKRWPAISRWPSCIGSTCSKSSRRCRFTVWAGRRNRLKRRRCYTNRWSNSESGIWNARGRGLGRRPRPSCFARSYRYEIGSAELTADFHERDVPPIRGQGWFEAAHVAQAHVDGRGRSTPRVHVGPLDHLPAVPWRV